MLYEWVGTRKEGLLTLCLLTVTYYLHPTFFISWMDPPEARKDINNGRGKGGIYLVLRREGIVRPYLCQGESGRKRA